MAYFIRRPNKNGKPTQVTIYVHENGKNTPLPRAKTRHLDGQPDHNINAWIAQHVEPDRLDDERIRWSDERLTKYLEDFEAYLKSEGKADATVQQHISLLSRFVIPFFLSLDTPIKDPNFWSNYTFKLKPWLESKKQPQTQIFRCNVALRLFYRYLQDENIVLDGKSLKLRNARMTKNNTPLKYTLSPSKVISWATACSDPTMKLLALIGYFFSLRSQELLALKKSDFRAGTSIAHLECVKTMGKARLFNKLVALVSRQKDNKSKVRELKTAGSKAWVSCFDKKAALMIIEGLNNFTGEDLFNEYQARHYYSLWKKNGLQQYSLKDLRRASLYWLGHNSKLSPLDLMKHARHSKFDTTALYLRRPEEQLLEETSQILSFN